MIGRIGEQNAVIACLPASLVGNNPAAAVPMHIWSTFRSKRLGIMISIEGSVLSVEADIRLGDVVVSQLNEGYCIVIQYDFDSATPADSKARDFSIRLTM